MTPGKRLNLSEPQLPRLETGRAVVQGEENTIKGQHREAGWGRNSGGDKGKIPALGQLP